jgi:hypothetical protein
MREEPEIKLSNKLAELKRLNQPPTKRVGNGVFNLTDAVLPAYFPPQRRVILGSISEQFESRAIEFL